MPQVTPLRGTGSDGRPSAAVVNGLAAVIALLVVAWLLWAAGKGLDLTDEGFYLVTARHPEDVVMLATAFHHLTSWILWATGGSIAAMRMVGVLGTVAACAILGDAALLVSGARRSWLAPATTVMGGLLAYSWLLLTPSYNTGNAWAVAGATACALHAFRAAGRPPFDRTRWRTWMFGCGFFLGISLFVKFPTAAAMGALVALAVAAWPELARRERVAASVTVATGAAAAAALMFLIVVSPQVWWREWTGGLAQATQLSAGHGVSALERYARELRGHFGEGTRPEIWGLWTLGFAAAAVAAAASGARIRTAARAAVWVVVAAAAGRSALETIAWLFPPALPTFVIRDYFPFWLARFHLHWLALATAIAAGAGLGTRWAGREPSLDARADRKRIIVGLLLAGGTVASAFGTANPIYLNLVLGLGSWFALLALVVRYGAARLDGCQAGHAAMLAAVAFAAVQIVGGTITVPYGLNDGLLEQTVMTSIGSPASQVALDPGTHRLVVELQTLARACGFEAGDDVLAFYNLPGLVYALGGRSPGLPWFTYGLSGSRVVNEMGLEAAGAARVSRAFILQTPDAEPWLSTLAGLGIDFPGRYAYCGAVTRPLRGLAIELKLWRPMASPHPEAANGGARQ